MAIDRQVAGVSVKQQSVWALLGLGIITFGIYVFFWNYRINTEMKKLGAAYGDAELANSKPGMTVLAMFIPIANLVSLHGIGKRIQRVQAITGRGADYSLGLHWLLALFTGLWFCYSQHALSSLYSWVSGGAGAAAPIMPGQANAGAVEQPADGPFVAP